MRKPKKVQTRKTQKTVSDREGHYDLDGVSQTQDLEVKVASDQSRSKKPAAPISLKAVFIGLKRWAFDRREQKTIR